MVHCGPFEGQLPLYTTGKRRSCTHQDQPGRLITRRFANVEVKVRLFLLSIQNTSLLFPRSYDNTGESGRQTEGVLHCVRCRIRAGTIVGRQGLRSSAGWSEVTDIMRSSRRCGHECLDGSRVCRMSGGVGAFAFRRADPAQRRMRIRRCGRGIVGGSVKRRRGR